MNCAGESLVSMGGYADYDSNDDGRFSLDELQDHSNALGLGVFLNAIDNGQSVGSVIDVFIALQPDIRLNFFCTSQTSLKQYSRFSSLLAENGSSELAEQLRISMNRGYCDPSSTMFPFGVENPFGSDSTSPPPIATEPPYK